MICPTLASEALDAYRRFLSHLSSFPPDFLHFQLSDLTSIILGPLSSTALRGIMVDIFYNPLVEVAEDSLQNRRYGRSTAAIKEGTGDSSSAGYPDRVISSVSSLPERGSDKADDIFVWSSLTG